MHRHYVSTFLVIATAASASAQEINNGYTGTRFAQQGRWRIAFELSRHERPNPDPGLPVVFVHGANSDRRMWHHQMAGLRWPGPRIAIDLLGYGESDKPEDADYSYATLAGSVNAVLTDLGIGRAVLVGHSNGVPTVYEFYRLFAEKTHALVLSDGALRAPLTPEMADWMRKSFERPDFEEFHRRMVERTPRGALSDDDFALVKKAALATLPHVMARGLDAMVDPESWRETPIDVPVLMIVSKGPGQTLWTDDNRILAESLIPDLDFQVWEGVTHFFPLERPEGFNRRVEVFLKGVACQ